MTYKCLMVICGVLLIGCDQQSDQKTHQRALYDRLYRQASRSYDNGEFQQVIDYLAPHRQVARFSALLNQVELLKGFVKRAKKTSCRRFINDEVSNIHIIIIEHPLVQARIKRCKKVLSPHTL